jgi:hypothetical protein
VTFGAPTTTITNLSATSITDSGNLTFTGTGNRIRGDFSNATVSNRVAFQTSTTDAATIVNLLPNGTNAGARLRAFNNSDATNSAYADVGVSSTSILFSSAIQGSGTYLPMTFLTGGSEAMRITTDRNVGIGTVSPDVNYKLHVVGNILATGSVRVEGTQIRVAGSSSAALPSIQPGEDADTGMFWPGSNTIGFSTGAQERMRIDSSGRLVVGTVSATNSKVTVDNTGSGGVYVVQTGAGGYSFVSNCLPLSSVYYHMQFLQSGTPVGNILSSGSSTSYNTSSDYRLKENVAPMQNALATVAALKPVTYTWKADGSEGQGFIAHELQEVVPDCVTGEKDAVDENGNPQYQGVDTSFLVATLVAAIKEQQALIQDLTTRLTALEGN